MDGELADHKRIDDDPSWLNGPPYAVEELVFDENELLGCFRPRPNCGVMARTNDERRVQPTPSGDARHRRQMAVGMRQHQRFDLPGS